MDIPLRKVTARIDPTAGNAFVRSQPRSRPGSPTKQSPTSSFSSSSFRPKVANSSNAIVRKLSSSSALSTSRTNNVSPSSLSRPGSPLKPSRVLANGPEASSSPKARIMARSTSRSGMSPVQTHSSSLEHRQRALTSASAKLKLPPFEDRPRSGSVIALHHALSISDLNATSSATLSQLSPSLEPSLVDIGRTDPPPVPAPIKIKSKVTNFAKSTSMNAEDAASRSLSPPYATTRPIHTRARTTSITSSFSLNDPPLPPSSFYPITSASPAANPHRYAPQRARSPARSHPSPTLPSEPNSTKRSPLVPKVDPASVPLPPHSPPISALSLSSKSSVSITSVPLNNGQTAGNQMSHIKRRSMERITQSNAFFSQAETMAQEKRDRSRSTERSPRDRHNSDTESEGPERQLRAEAKTNRKIADLEITNRSLLAINASLETTKNRQAKEIRDLRRKLRESRLILPPRTYKAVQSALEEREEDEEDEDSDVEEGPDETFQRVSNLIDGLIESGKRALEMRPEDMRASLATKVLNADELRSWRDSGQRTALRDSYMDKHGADDETRHSHLSPALVAVPDSDSASSMESDGEVASNSARSSALPPITITHSL